MHSVAAISSSSLPTPVVACIEGCAPTPWEVASLLNFFQKSGKALPHTQGFPGSWTAHAYLSCGQMLFNNQTIQKLGHRSVQLCLAAVAP